MEMAIKDEILEDFFSRPKKTSNISQKFRVFDDPVFDKKTEDKPRTNWRHNRGQTEDKPRTNRGQTEDKFATKKLTRRQTGDTTEDITEDKTRTKRGQTEDKPRTNYTFSALVGLQRKIAFFIYEASRTSINGITKPISLQHISDRCKTTEISAKKTIQRLEKNGLILRIEFKAGRGGWTRYSLPENILQEIIRYETEDKLRTNRGQTEDKLETELETQSRTSPSSSSSNIYIKTTTTSEPEIEQNFDNLEEWKKLDFEPLVEIGFSQTHLLQIAKQNLLDPTAVQESIYAFAFDLQNNGKSKLLKKSPIDFFMGILRNGSVYAPPSNYKSPKEIALEVFIEKQNHIQELEEKAVKLGFENWILKVSSEEKNSIVPEETRKTGISALVNQTLRTHFKENIWPTMRKEIMQVPLDT
jgi:hypothetical protein